MVHLLSHVIKFISLVADKDHVGLSFDLVEERGETQMNDPAAFGRRSAPVSPHLERPDDLRSKTGRDPGGDA